MLTPNSICGALLVAASVSNSMATVTATTIPTTANATTQVIPLGGDRYRVLCVNNDWNSITFVIEGSSTDTIEYLKFRGSETLAALIRVQQTGGGTGGIGAVEEIVCIDSDSSDTISPTWFTARLDILGDLGSIDGAHSIASSNIGGDVTGNITIPRRPNNVASSLPELRVTGSVLGDIEVDGNINVLDIGGSLGTSGVPIAIDCRRINSAQVTGHVYADISTRFGGAVGQLRSLDIGGNWIGSGEFYDVDSPNGTDSVNIDGNLDADVTVTTTVELPWTVGGDLTGEIVIGSHANDDITVAGDLTGLLRIDGDLIGDLTIEGDAGLTGQVIINGADSADTWQGDVVVGTTSPLTLGSTQSQPNEAPFYETLGGGAIGQAPFNFHAEASTPTQGSTVFLVDDGSGTSTAETYDVTIEHYGPVFQDGSGAPLLIEKGTCAYQADVTANFDFTVSTSSTTSQRTVKIKPSSGNAWETGRYFFTPDGAVNRLACASVNLSPDAAYIWDDAVDFNGDGSADSADLAELIANID